MAAVTAKQGPLNASSADRLVTRLRGHADRMISPGDAGLLREAAGTLERLTTRIKSATFRSPVKAAPRPQPDIAAMIRQHDAERMASAGPFSSTDFETTERERIAEQNRQLAEKNKRAEQQRARQLGQDEQPNP